MAGCRESGEFSTKGASFIVPPPIHFQRIDKKNLWKVLKKGRFGLWGRISSIFLSEIDGGGGGGGNAILIKKKTDVGDLRIPNEKSL